MAGSGLRVNPGAGPQKSASSSTRIARISSNSIGIDPPLSWRADPGGARDASVVDTWRAVV
jgi:hypothetical protein